MLNACKLTDISTLIEIKELITTLFDCFIVV